MSAEKAKLKQRQALQREELLLKAKLETDRLKHVEAKLCLDQQREQLLLETEIAKAAAEERVYLEAEGEYTSTQKFHQPEGEYTSTKKFHQPEGEYTSTQKFHQPEGEYTSTQKFHQPEGEYTSTQKFHQPEGKYTSIPKFHQPEGEYTSSQKFHQPEGEYTSTQKFHQPGGEYISTQKFHQPEGEYTSTQKFHQPEGEYISTQKFHQPQKEYTSIPKFHQPVGECTPASKSHQLKGVDSPVVKSRQPEAVDTDEISQDHKQLFASPRPTLGLPLDPRASDWLPERRPNAIIEERNSIMSQRDHNGEVVRQIVNIQQQQNEQFKELLVHQRNQTLALTLPQPQMPVFSGDPIDYCNFERAFESLIETKTSSENARLYYLIQYTSGEVQELMRSCLSMPPEKGYKTARQLLKSRYGQNYKIAVACITKVIDGPPIKAEDGPALERYSVLLTSCKNTLKEIGYINKIENSDSSTKNNRASTFWPPTEMAGRGR